MFSCTYKGLYTISVKKKPDVIIVCFDTYAYFFMYQATINEMHTRGRENKFLFKATS